MTYCSYADYWRAVKMAWENWVDFRKAEKIYFGARGYYPYYVAKRKQVKKAYHDGEWSQLQRAYDDHRESLYFAIDKADAIGLELGFDHLLKSIFIDYVEEMTDYERRRCRQLINQFVEEPKDYPFTDILRRNFRKHQNDPILT